MPEKSVLDYAADMLTTPLRCICGHQWNVKSIRFAPNLRTTCPKCRHVDHIDECTASRVNAELNEALEEVAQHLGVPFSPIPMPKPRVTRKLQPRQPKGYPVAVVGESFYQAAVRSCSAGDIVLLIHEPLNRHDSRAIKVTSESGAMLGYLPRDSFVHRLLLDERGECRAHVLKLTGGDHGQQFGLVLDVEIT